MINGSNYTVLILAKDEPLRIKSTLMNFPNNSNIIVLLDYEDTETEPILREMNVRYVQRPSEYMVWPEMKKTEWVLNQSPTDYVFICYTSFHIPNKVLKIFEEESKKGIYQVVKHGIYYWSYGSIVQEPAIFKKPDSGYLFNKKYVLKEKASIHNEYKLSEECKILYLPINKSNAIHVFRDDDMPTVVKKHIIYAETEAHQMHAAGINVNMKIIIWKVIRAFINNYIRMGGFKYGIQGLIFNLHYAFYIFLVYSRLWEINNGHDFSRTREEHNLIKIKMINEQR